MASLDDLLSAIPLDQLAGRLGVDEATARQAAATALPALLGGMQANARDADGARSLGKAVAEHDASLVRGRVSLDDVDTADGRKIVHHVFGSQEDQVVAQLADASGTQSGLLSKVLPALAPIALSFLADQLGGTQGSAPTTAGEPATTTRGGGIGDLLGGLLGGGAGSGSGGGIGDLLGGLGGLLGQGRR